MTFDSIGVTEYLGWRRWFTIYLRFFLKLI